MQFMTVFTYEPSERNEVIRRRAERGMNFPKGVKLIGEWTYIGAGRVFTLVDVDNPKDMIEASQPWTDIGKLEVYPVVEVETILPLMLETVSSASVR